MRLIRLVTSKIPTENQFPEIRTANSFNKNYRRSQLSEGKAGIWTRSLVAVCLSFLIIGGAVSVGATIVPFHAVTFHENDSPLDSVITSETNNAAAPLTVFTNLVPTFVNPGYTFANWNTSEFGNGIQYLDGSVYNFAAGPIDLYAQWTENSVTFNENRTGADTTNVVEPGNTVGALTFFSNLSPSFSDPGYTFAGWTTNANGTGTSYANGATYDFRTGDLVLFAQWNVVPTETASFSPAGGTGSVSPMSSQQGSTISLPGATGFTYSGYTFAGWNTAANGSGSAFAPGANYTLTSNVTLYAQWLANTVTFFENDSSGDANHAIQSSSVIALLNLFSTLSPSFTNPGYSFAGWTTSADGLGTLYADGASFDFRNGSTALYARWTLIPTDHVSFSGNGGTGLGSTVSGLQGSSITLLGASAFTFTGHSFVGWNTQASGAGSAYEAGALFALSSDLTLYAQWSPDVYDVTYVANGGSVSPGATTYVVDSSGLMLPTPLYAGHTFTGWFTAASGGTLAGLGGASYTPTAALTLFAQWTADTYLVTFDAGGGSVNPTTSSFVVGAAALTFPTPVNGTITFLGWYSAASGGTLDGAGGASFTPTSSMTLYARWQSPVLYTLTFDPNGGTGSIAPVSGPSGSTVTLPGVTGLSRPGFTLVKWSTTKTGAGTSYVSGSTTTLMASLTLFARWTGHAPVVLLGAVGPFAGHSTGLTAAMRSQVARFAARIKSHHYKTVSLYGYAADTGQVSLTRSISARRAASVAAFLRSRLAALHVRATIKSAGEGSIGGVGAASNSRVEVLAK